MTTQTTSAQAGLATALEHAEWLLERDPALARQQAEAILEAVPRHAATTVVLAAAHRLSGDPAQALTTVAPLARALPTMVSAQIELGLTLAELGRTTEAVAAFQRAVSVEPRAAEAWRGLAEGLDLLGDKAGAEKALAQQLRASTRDPALIEAAAALVDNRLGVAEQRLRDHLADHPPTIAGPAHAGRGRRAAGPLRGRRAHADPVPGDRSRLRRRPAQPGDHALSAGASQSRPRPRLTGC
jgi:Flp pilus assembly protein TadD